MRKETSVEGWESPAKNKQNLNLNENGGRTEYSYMNV
jgi:hypothetical protein